MRWKGLTAALNCNSPLLLPLLPYSPSSKPCTHRGRCDGRVRLRISAAPRLSRSPVHLVHGFGEATPRALLIPSLPFPHLSTPPLRPSSPLTQMKASTSAMGVAMLHRTPLSSLPPPCYPFPPPSFPAHLHDHEGIHLVRGCGESRPSAPFIPPLSSPHLATPPPSFPSDPGECREARQVLPSPCLPSSRPALPVLLLLAAPLTPLGGTPPVFRYFPPLLAQMRASTLAMDVENQESPCIPPCHPSPHPARPVLLLLAAPLTPLESTPPVFPCFPPLL